MSVAVNSVNVIGKITNVQRLPDGQVRVRLAVQRIPGQPVNPDGKNFDGLTALFSPAFGIPPRLDRGQTVAIAGFLQQRDERVSLEGILNKAGAWEELPKEVKAKLSGVRVPRGFYEIVAQSWRILGNGNGSARRREAQPSGEEA